MSRNCEDIPVFILMSTPLFCLLIPYMGNREVCLEYCTGIRSNLLLQLPVDFTVENQKRHCSGSATFIRLLDSIYVALQVPIKCSSMGNVISKYLKMINNLSQNECCKI